MKTILILVGLLLLGACGIPVSAPPAYGNGGQSSLPVYSSNSGAYIQQTVQAPNSGTTVPNPWHAQ